MYNADLKKKFLEHKAIEGTSVGRLDQIASILNLISDQEEKLDKNIYEFAVDEFQTAIDAAYTGRPTYQTGALYTLKVYIRWCEESGYDINSDILDVSSTTDASVKGITVKDPTGMQEYLDSVFEDPKLKTAHLIYRGYMWLSYMGVPPRDALKTRINDVDLGRRIIRYQNKEIDIYREALLTFRNCVECDSFLIPNANYSKISYRSRANNNLLLRGIDRADSKGGMDDDKQFSTMVVRMRRVVVNKQPDSKFTAEKAYRSGIYYRIYQKELATGVEPDFRSYAKDKLGMEGYLETHTRRAYLNRINVIEKTERTDYERWKSAWNL